jgi:hypothetical protein
LSTDGGDNWFDVSDGLPAFPKAVRLRFVTHPNGNYIYLGTYGRSIWRSPAQTQPLAAVGTLQDFTIAPTEVVGGVQNSVGTVTIAGQDPLDDANVEVVSSNNGIATVNSPAIVPPGADTATFPIVSKQVIASEEVGLTATYGASRSPAR